MTLDNDTPVRFIVPLTVTAAQVTSSNAVVRLPSELDWSATTNYTVGQIVFRPGISRRFENRVAGVNSNPPEDDQARWYDLGSTDKMSMFDGEVSTQSIAPETLTVVFQPGAFNSLYLAGLDGQSLRVEIRRSPGGAVDYFYDGSLEDSLPEDYYEYFFAPFVPRTDFTALDTPPYANSQVTLTVRNPGGTARLGMVSVGDLVSTGAPPEAGARMKVKNYSKIDVDGKGKTTVERGRKARDLSVSITVDIGDASMVANSLDRAADIPCAIIGSDRVELSAMRTFGLLSYEVNFRSIDAVFNINVQGTL